MQNKPNLPEDKNDAKCVFTTDYENKWQRKVRKNKPNSNPIKPNLKRAKMNINLNFTKVYRKKDDFVVRINKPNSKPISEKPKMNVNLYVIEDYREMMISQSQKTNPIKPNCRKAMFCGQGECISLLIDRHCDRDILSQKATCSAHVFANVVQGVSSQFGCTDCIGRGADLELKVPRLGSFRLVALRRD